MKRPALVILMAAAVILTALLAFTQIGGSGGDRGGRSAGIDERDPARRDPPADVPSKGGDTHPRPNAATVYEVSGRVTDTRGRGVAEAVVRGRWATAGPLGGDAAVTDAGGRYRLACKSGIVGFDVTATGYLPLVGTVNGRLLHDRLLVCDGEGPWQKDFVLTSAATLFGRVFDDSRQPVAGARVYVIAPDRALIEEEHIGVVVPTDKEGYFRFAGLAAGTYDLGVRAQGYLPTLRRDVVVGESGEAERMLSVRAGRTVRARVRNATDTTRVVAWPSTGGGKAAVIPPPGGLEVLADALVGRPYIEYPVVSVSVREEGIFMLRGVVPEAADVAARDPRRITERGLGHLTGVTEDEVELTLVTAAEIEIRVLDEQTRAPLDPSVHRMRDDRPVPVTFVAGAATVPADGRDRTLYFRLDGYEETRLELPGDARSWPESFEVLMRPSAEGETGGFTLEFDRPVAQRVALVGRDAGGRQAWTKHLSEDTEKDAWTVSGLPFGEFSVSVLATGMIPVTLPRVVIAKGLNERHRVALSAGGGVEIKVTDADGKPLDKVGLLLKDSSGNRIDIHIMMYLSDRRAFVSVNSLPVAATARADSGLAPGAYTLAAYRQGYESATEEFVLRGTEVAQVTLVLRAQ